MKTAKEWCEEWDSAPDGMPVDDGNYDEPSIELLHARIDAIRVAHAEFVRAIQADALEAAALEAGVIQNAIAVDAQAERSVNPKADASVALKEIALLGAAMAAIRKLKETP